MAVTLDDYDNMRPATREKLRAAYDAARSRIVNGENRDALRSLAPLLEHAVEYAARKLLVNALTKRFLHPDKPYLWELDVECARRIIDNREDANRLLRDAEREAESNAGYLRSVAELYECDALLRPL